MKHLTYFTFFCLAVNCWSGPCSAYTSCEGGNEVTANNGLELCVSFGSMNWWSATNWCKANGGQLVSLDKNKICPKIIKSNKSSCSNLPPSLVGENSSFWLNEKEYYLYSTAYGVYLSVPSSPNLSASYKVICE